MLAQLRPARATEADVARVDFPSQTRFIGLRFTDALRDRLRRTWLRLRRADD